MEREAKALTVVPWGNPSDIAVTTETGVQTPAITARKPASRACRVGVASGRSVPFGAPVQHAAIMAVKYRTCR